MIDILKPLINKFLPFAQEKMGFDKPPRLFLKNDSKNAGNPLGKTAFYDPAQKAVTLYVSQRHPKDVMRSLSHELVHHTQNCRGDFNNVGEMGEGYAQSDEHLREMEREAYEVGNMCFRDWEDSLKSTIYYEHLQKGEKKMSLKDWKNGELSTLLSEAWGFKFNSLKEFEEFDGTGEIQEVSDQAGEADGEEESRGEAVDDQEKKAMDESAFAPNHYCVHHGGVSRGGGVEIAEAVSHNYDQELGRVTHYDMKFQDGAIMEGVPFEDIQVTSASLAEGHSHPPGKRDEDEEDVQQEAAGAENEEDIEEGGSAHKKDPRNRRQDDERARPMEEVRAYIKNIVREQLRSKK